MLNTISLKKRLWLSLSLLWAVIILCSVIAIHGLLDTQRSLRLIHEDRMATVAFLTLLERNYDETRSHVFRGFQHNPDSELHLLHDHPLSRHTDAIKANQENSKDLRERLMARSIGAEEEPYRDNIISALNAWSDKLDPVTTKLSQHDYSNEVMFSFLQAMNKEGAEVQRAIQSMSDYQSAKADEAATRAESDFKSSMLFFALLYVFLALPATLFMVMSLRRLNHGLSHVERAVDAIAEGDLTYKVVLSGNDEMTQVKRKIIAMQNNLISLIEGIREGTHTIEADISSLSQLSRELVDRNVQQSASLEETSAATEELNGTVEHNADNARQAEKTAQEANSAAIRGGDAVKDVVTIMGEINESSTHISNIVTIIDSIAFQTNILALNAAVEAARAGEQGRGFAVVASEVRTLAQRSASAAGDIKKLVEESIGVVNNGGVQVNRTGETMRDIVEGNAKLSTLIAEISNASSEQVVGLSQINQAMMLMDRSNHENNELAANTDEITQNLYSQSQHLLDLVGTFRLPNSSIIHGGHAKKRLN